MVSAPTLEQFYAAFDMVEMTTTCVCVQYRIVIASKHIRVFRDVSHRYIVNTGISKLDNEKTRLELRFLSMQNIVCERDTDTETVD